MNNKSVSVIIPAYNVESSLGRCIDSVLSQSLKPFETIVINDGSSDGTAQVAQKYGNDVIYLEQENSGQGAARNAGLSVANGRFVAFLDADDYWLPGFLERTVDFLLTHKEAVAVNTGFIIKKWGSEYVSSASIARGVNKERKGYVVENFFDFWAEYDHVRTGTVLMRREIIEKAGFQRADLRISQDLEYWGYIATFGKWGFIPEPLWVGNSREVAKRDWAGKYWKRRSLCPTVESWERRVVPRLKRDEIVSFQIVRGRVAASFAQSKILAGSFDEAFDIFQKYGTSMPRNRLTILMRTGAALDGLGWALACRLIRLKEYLKSWRLNILARVASG